MMAPPGYPKITSTPAASSARHRMSAPESISLIGSHSPEVAGVEGLIFQLVRVAHLVERVYQGARARLDDVRRRAVPGERLAVDPRLHQHLPQAVATRRHRLHREVHDVDLTLDGLADRGERRRDRPIPGSGGRALRPRPPVPGGP